MEKLRMRLVLVAHRRVVPINEKSGAGERAPTGGSYGGLYRRTEVLDRAGRCQVLRMRLTCSRAVRRCECKKCWGFGVFWLTCSRIGGTRGRAVAGKSATELASCRRRVHGEDGWTIACVPEKRLLAFMTTSRAAPRNSVSKKSRKPAWPRRTHRNGRSMKPTVACHS